MRFAPIPLTRVILILFAAGPAHGNDTTKQFPAFNCRYTIQSDDWDWVADAKTGLCTAAHDRGWGFNLSVERANGSYVTPMIIRGMDETMMRLNIQKRGGRKIAFLGLPCYQFEGTLADGRTTAIRLLVVNGLAYHLTVVGGKQPIEADPAFEECMAGFELLVPPAPPKPEDDTAGIIALIVIIGGACLFVFLIARANRQPQHKPPPAGWLKLGDDFLRERPVADPYTPTVRAPGGSSAATMTMPTPRVEVIRDTTKNGPCRACRRLVPADVSQCEWCCANDPNPSRKRSNAGFGLLVGAYTGGLIASLSCWGVTGEAGSAVGGLLFGALGGAFLGAAGGVLYDRVKGKRGNG